MYPQYMCIVPYVLVIWCNGIAEIYCQLGWGRCMFSICAFCHMLNLFGVMIFHRCIVNWSGGYVYPQYMCILLYMKLIWCNCIPYIYCSFEWGVDVCSIYVYFAICETDLMSWYSMDLLSIGVGGTCILSICALCYMWKLFGVMVFHIPIVDWGVYVCSIYVHSVICETYLV